MHHATELKMAVPKRKLVLWILCVVNICSFMFFAGIHGDVPDDVVYTELHKDVRIGDRAVLTCRFRGLPLAVYWKKGYDPRRSPNLVSWIPTDDVNGVNRCVTAHSSVKVETTSVTYELAKDTFTSSRNVDISDLQSVFKTQDKETNQAQPDLTTNLEVAEQGKIGMSVWALRTITVQRHTKQNVISETSVTEEYFPLVTFVRLGRAPLSKSKLINDILRDDGHDTFFHKDCINGTIPRRISDGLVECSWFITIGERKDHLPDTTMVLNLRGDASLMKKQMQILKEISSVIFVTASDQDLAKPQNTNTFREILQTNAKIILLLICGKHEQGTLACFEAIGKDFLKNVSIILSRTRKGIEKNASELKSESREKLTEAISGCPGTVVNDFAQRARELGIIIDEYDKACLEGKDLAEKIVSKLKGKEIIDCKRLLLPLQGAEWTEYCKLLKMHHRTSGQGSQSTSAKNVHVVKQKMDRLREKQVDICRNRLTPFIKDFMSNLQKNLDVVMYFLKWMDLLLKEISKANLSELHRQYNTTWRKFQEAKMQQKNTEVQHLISQVNDAENRLASASLGLENLFREIGQIYEAVKGDCKVGKDTWTDVEYLPEIAAKLLLNGIPFELVDGDTSVIPIVWVSAVLSQLGNIIGKKRLFVLSVLGIQSSGKSTLLNTMFGLQFAVSAGRCTRGANMQLIPVEENADLPFDYVAVVDTEGLRAPELMQLSYEHDNELATLVIGLGDVTMINIKRENTNQMKDIMQIAVHAFLRMDLARKHIRDPQTCLFLHQNTPAARAEEVMMHVKENLDNMTKDAALCENIKSIQLFSQIINFDIRKHVCFFSDLWYGNPPMARANSAYSENVGALRSNMLGDIAKTQRTFLTTAGLSSRLASLWNRILDDDFVFRFRNSLEVKAYNCLKSKYYTLEWQLQNKLKSWLPTAERKMKICDTIECLEKTHKSFVVGLDKVLRGKAEEIETQLMDYFKRNNLQGIVKQWQQSELKQLTCAVEQQQKEGRTYLLSIKEARQVELVQTQKWSKHQTDILNKAVELADKLEGEEATVEVEKAFDIMWMSMVRDIATTTDEKLKMDVVIEGILHKRFHAHRAILRDELKRHPLKNPLKETSLESSITADDERKEHIKLKGLTIMKRTNIQAVAINIQSQARHKIMEETVLFLIHRW
ncbi:interferon-induced very large GTPase 1-like [Lytechinus variegatus]|uniref:interferon-induced very large GTPase 1-like n=1 Tax=Lytechinus variegatus TaxID=7654 RepID=UPI001BB27698|nr:interferon-induced very large GTPase 1-like [Lytechinus variegatus]